MNGGNTSNKEAKKSAPMSLEVVSSVYKPIVLGKPVWYCY